MAWPVVGPLPDQACKYRANRFRKGMPRLPRVTRGDEMRGQSRRSEANYKRPIFGR